MSNRPTNKAALRYRLYFWLMDLSLIFAFVGLANHLLHDSFSQRVLEQIAPLYIAIGAITLVFNFFVPPLLMLAKFMRDEYAEILWQRSVAVLACVAAVAPFVMFAGAMLYDLAIGSDSSVSPMAQLFAGLPAGRLFITMWMSFLLAWVGIFQFLRWNDSR